MICFRGHLSLTGVDLLQPFLNVLIFSLQHARQVFPHGLLGTCQAWGDESREMSTYVFALVMGRKKGCKTALLFCCGIAKRRFCGDWGESLSVLRSLSFWGTFKQRWKTWTGHPFGCMGSVGFFNALNIPGVIRSNICTVMCRFKFIHLLVATA